MNTTTEGRRVANRLTHVNEPVVITSPVPAPRSSRFPFRLALVSLVLLGFGLRAAALLSSRCLWIDEAMLALNLLDRPAARLLEPLDWNQGAPVGFLLLAKFAITLFGDSEWALRLVPFAGSILGLLGFSWLCVRLLPRPTALLAVGLFAVSPSLVSYAGECKQYETDAAFAIGLFAAAAGLLQEEYRPRRWLILAFAGAVAVWFSHPAMFVLAGIGTALFANAAWNRDRPALLWASLMGGCWLLSFAACYFVCLRHLSENKYLLEYWAGHFLALPPRSVGELAWVVDHLFDFFRSPGGFDGKTISAASLAAIFAAMGLGHLTQRQRGFAAAVLLTVAFTLLASGVRKYPFGGRLLLFLVPLAILLVAVGASVLVEALGRRGRGIAILMVGMLCAGSVLETAVQFRSPPRAEEVRPVLAFVRERWQPGDRLYVYYGAEPGFRYYTRTAPFPTDAVTFGTEHRGEPVGYRKELPSFSAGQRLWVLFAHRHGAEELVIRTYLDANADSTEFLQKPGAAAYLYTAN